MYLLDLVKIICYREIFILLLRTIAYSCPFVQIQIDFEREKDYAWFQIYITTKL